MIWDQFLIQNTTTTITTFGFLESLLFLRHFMPDQLQNGANLSTAVTAADKHRKPADAVPSLYILRLNKYSKISNSWIGLVLNRIVTNYSIRSKIRNIRTTLNYYYR